MTPEEHADRLAEIAVDLVTRVRDEAPAEVHRWLRDEMEGEDWMALAIVLAAAIPDDRSWDCLTRWAQLRVYGTGHPDTPEKIAQRRRDLTAALDGAWRNGYSRRVA
jgi:hypothetical protein